MNTRYLWLKIVCGVVLLIFGCVFLIRLLSSPEIDDVSPSIPCDASLLKNNNVLWVIPLFDNRSIANEPRWCAQIKALNKTLGMHGVYHVYREMSEPRSDSYFEEGISAFKQCFGFKPVLFKPPQLVISKENKETLQRLGFKKVYTLSHQRLHKVYHCNDTGDLPNWMVKWI